MEIESVISKTSPKTKLSKTKKYNVSIVQHLHHSKNEALARGEKHVHGTKKL